MYYESSNTQRYLYRLIEALTPVDEALIHRTQESVVYCIIPNPDVFGVEIVFEWALPKKHVFYQIFPQIPIDHGAHHHFDELSLSVSTSESRARITVDFRLRSCVDLSENVRN